MVFTLISNHFFKARIRKEFSSKGYCCPNGEVLSQGFLTFCGIDSRTGLPAWPFWAW